MNKYRPIIIGCGKQGVGEGQEKSHKIINFADALTKHNGFGGLHFIDNDINKMWKAADLYDGLPSYSIENSFKWIPQPNIAVVTTPDNTHYEILKQLAEYPLKLVICEKPICEDLEEARKIVELYKQKNISLMVNYTRRFLPYYNKLKEYGKPIAGGCIFNKGWLHTATHAIDFFNMIKCDDYIIQESKADKRYWSLTVNYGDYEFTETRIGDMPVWNYYDKTHWHVIENAYNFLEGKEKIKCTGEMALQALKKCYELMGAIK